MINTRVEDNIIRISCTRNQIIGAEQLKRIYRAGNKIVEQLGIASVIVDIERNVDLSNDAKEIFKRLDTRCVNTTLVIIVG